MFCYHCGCHLSEQDYCTACGADVATYKKIMAVSNLFYNEGLEKATVRDLSGAIVSLRQSLKFNKYNIEARNLLGLVLYEMGEEVSAMSEWVLSQNLRGEKNLANEYMKLIQSTPGRLDTMTTTIRKYNQAYYYCVNESKDLAIIQLKRVLGMNPKYVRAHQLLALLYIDAEEYEKAKKELTRALRVDCNNTLCLRYLKEVEAQIAGEEAEKGPGAKKHQDATRFQTDNEVIIQPIHNKTQRSNGLSTVINMILGIIIGAAAMYYLAVPAAKQQAQSEYQAQIVDYGNKLDAKTSDIQSLNAQIASLKGERDDLQRQILGYEGDEGKLSTIDSLLKAANIYIQSGDIHEVAVCMDAIYTNVDVTQTSEAFQSLYQTLFTTIGPKLSLEYREEGYAYYRSEEMVQALDYLEKAVFYDATNAEALYDLGNAYKKNEDVEKASDTFRKVQELFPDSEWSRRAQSAIETMGNE